MLTEILAACVGLAVLAGGATVVVKAFKVLKRWGDALDDWAGEPARPGVQARLGVMERLAAIEAQLRPNGGSSARDAVDRVEQVVTRVEATLDQHIGG